MSSRALVGSTKYVVVSHSVTSCSAVLNTNVNRVLHVCTGDGRSIVGGSVSIPNASTVSVSMTVDEHGAAQVAGSTVTVEGGTTTLSGNVQLSGTLKPVGGLVLANGTTVSGVGAGAVITGATNYKSLAMASNIKMTDTTISGCTTTADNDIGQSNACLIYVKDSIFTNCKFFENKITHGAAGVFYSPSGCTFTNCIFSDNIGRSGGDMYLAYGTTVSVIGCTFTSIPFYASTSAASSSQPRLYLSGNNRLTGRIGPVNTAIFNCWIYLANGTTINMAGTTNKKDTMRATGIICDGTATIIYDGGTKVVSETGSYFYANGETNLTVVS